MSRAVNPVNRDFAQATVDELLKTALINSAVNSPAKQSSNSHWLRNGVATVALFSAASGLYYLYLKNPERFAFKKSASKADTVTQTSEPIETPEAHDSETFNAAANLMREEAAIEERAEEVLPKKQSSKEELGSGLSTKECKATDAVVVHSDPHFEEKSPKQPEPTIPWYYPQRLWSTLSSAAAPATPEHNKAPTL